jgi:hypothetical protein
MADATQTLREDIAFMRALAEDGGREQARGGLLMGGGLIYAAASLFHWSVFAQLWTPPLGFWSVDVVWLAASALFIALLTVVRLRQPAGSGNRAARTAWVGMSWAIWTICIGIGLAAWRTHDVLVFGLIPPMVLALYAGSWMVAAVVYTAPWARRLGFAALAASLGVAFLAGQASQYLAFAIALLLFAALPGFLFLQRARRAA